MKFHSYTSRTKTKILNPIKSLKIQCFLSLRQGKKIYLVHDSLSKIARSTKVWIQSPK